MFKKKDPFKELEVIIDQRTGFEIPVRYYVAEMTFSYFDAPLEALRDLVPTRQLHPIRKSKETGVLCIITSLCQHTSIGQYISVALAVPVTQGKKPAPAMLPLLFEESWPNKGYYIFKEGVSTSEAFQVGTEFWGYPCFLANIESGVKDNYQETAMAEEERILSIRSRRPDYVSARPDKQEICFYSIKDDDRMLETNWYLEGSIDRSRQPDSAQVLFGEHPMVSQFKENKVGPNCFETRYYVSLRVYKPRPQKVINLRIEA